MKNAPIIQTKKMNKFFPAVHALKGVDLEMYAGEVLALVGENGAGKSTLIKIISGVYDFTDGIYLINGENANIKKPSDAIEKGISIIYQELNVVGSVTVAENVYFGRLPQKYGKVNWKKLYADTQKVLDKIGLDVSPKIKLQHLSIAQQQLVEIGKAISLDARVIIMDEPTSALSPKEIKKLMQVIKDLRSQGVAIMYVSHKLEEVFEISDRISIFRDGELVDCVATSDITEQKLIEAMVGRKIDDMFPKHTSIIGETVLEVENLNTEKITDISFTIKAGEIVGFSGLMGAGRTEMAMGLFGVDKRLSGKVRICKKEIPPNSPLKSREMGMGYVVENRKEYGILSQLSVKKNMTIVSLNQITNFMHINGKAEYLEVENMVGKLNIKTPNSDQLISKLSGGNQQKVLLARWLIKSNLKLLIIDEPTRGIDIGAKAEIYNLMNELSNQGLAILMISSELMEIMGMCNRVYVMKDGKITAEFDKKDATQELLLEKAIH